MSDTALRELASAAGVASSWKDVFGATHEVTVETLRAVLAALAYPADTQADVTSSLAKIRSSDGDMPPLVTAERGAAIPLPGGTSSYRLELEDGRMFEGDARRDAGRTELPAILECGYHRLTTELGETLVGVAPRTCFTAGDALRRVKGWGLAVQLYALRGKADAGVGDFAALADFAGPAARCGADAIGLSPVHAQFSADPDRFSPYAPSSRTALNVLHAHVDTPNPALARGDLVEWPEVSRFRLAELRRMFAAMRDDAAEAAAFADFSARHGQRLRAHAIFEALHAHFFARSPADWHWRNWPAEFRAPHSDAVSAFAEANADDVGFHAWMQFHADRGLEQAQRACRDAGMAIGLVSDLAVGTDSGGSQCWSRQNDTLLGLTVGAPPDLLQRNGQNWGLTAFSPTGLRASGYLTYREMLQAAMAHAGGVRIDHAMGLNRLWVIPDGASGAQGAYLSFPETDLLRLIKLESLRHRAIVLAEDLGTVPEGFQDRLRDAGIDGMRVLWFERDEAQHFVPPAAWTPRAVAMTSTHDLATLAGWWSGRDIEWRTDLHLVADHDAAIAEREADREAIWSSLCQSGAADGERPASDVPARFVDAACAYVGRSACELVMLPIEDALGLPEQPNLPGTLHEHPNWRRRLPATVDKVLEEHATRQRLAALDSNRGQ